MPLNTSKIGQIRKVIPFFQHDDAARDDKIDNYFVTTRYYSELPTDGSIILVGRYGAGKTAFLQELVKKRHKEDTTLYIVSISLKADMFVEEIRDVKKSKDYATFCRALIYLHMLYSIAEESEGTLTTGNKAKLIKELKSLDLQPYGDIISRIAGVAWRTLKRVKALSIKEVFSIELHGQEKAILSMRRYRQLCLKIEPIIRRLLNERKVLIVVDALDATSAMAVETASLVGTLIAWLLEEEQKTTGSLQCLLALPSNLLRVYRAGAGHIPAQDAFIKIEWDRDELEKIMINRVKAALGNKINAKKWLLETLGVDVIKTHAYTFNCPRNYVKMIRKCLQVKDTHPTISVKDCWLKGLERYCSETLEWLQSEWQLAGRGFEELTALLKSLSEKFEEKKLRIGIEEIRQSGQLETRSVNSIIEELKKWKLVIDAGKEGGKKRLKSHPILRTNVYFE